VKLAEEKLKSQMMEGKKKTGRKKELIDKNIEAIRLSKKPAGE